VVLICHLGFGIWTWFVIWILAFELYLSFASLHQPVNSQGSQI